MICVTERIFRRHMQVSKDEWSLEIVKRTAVYFFFIPIFLSYRILKTNIT